MKEKIKKILIFVLVMLLSVTNVDALSVTKAGDAVVQKGEYDSIRLVAGNSVTNRAKIDGLSFAAGNDVLAEGNVSYGLYAGNNIVINETVEKDLFVAGNNITIGSDAIIGRDVYIAGNKIIIKTDIKRDLRLASSSVDLSGVTVNGDAYIAAENIIFDENTVIVGKLTYSEDANVTGLDLASVGSVKIMETQKIVVETSLKDSIYSFVISYCAALVTMIVLFYFLPELKNKLNKLQINASNIAKIACIGLLLLIVTPVISLIAMFSGILTPVALITLALYAISIYVSILFVGYIIGNKIISKYLGKDNTYLSLACGILLIKLIKLVPVIGNIIYAIVLFYGLGIIYNLIKPKR